jgi:hypothetical protein
MKTRPLITLVLIAAFLLPAARLHARTPTVHDDYSSDSMAIDAVVARPLCFAATIVGMGFFAATLPITLVSRSTGKAAKSLVGRPAHLTFTRKLGNMSELSD